MRLPYSFLAFVGLFSITVAARADTATLWSDVAVAHRDAALTAADYRELELDRPALRALQDALRDGGTLALPLPDGGLSYFEVADSGTMPPELTAKFPEIVSLSGIDTEGRRARIDISPAGLHAMVFGEDGIVVLQPAHYDSSRYHSFAREDYVGQREPFQCDAHAPASAQPSVLDPKSYAAPPKLTTGSTLRTYRIAIAATGEYTTRVCLPNSAAVSCGLAAIVTSLNRVNGVYENDLAVRLTLIPNNDVLVYTNGTSDPYTNNNGGTMLSQNQTNLDNTSVLGSANYDVGHVFSTGGGGVAGLGVTCANGSKARGVTGRGTPLGDPFDIDYVAHEIGHQFGGNHTFNGNAGSCGGNRASNAAYEPGSGSTIMAYAGICDAQDLQPNSDPYFHAKSLDEIALNIGNDTCEVETATGNTAPVISALTNRTIPARTPFRLTATATDAAGQSLTYAWEQFDLGTTQTTATPVSSTLYPLFRSFNPTSDPGRTFPRLQTILNPGTSPSPNEVLPTATWPAGTPMTFRLTVRDNRNSGGGTQSADVNLTVSDGGSAFAVTSPTTGTGNWVCGESRTVTWNVAGTSGAPVSCSQVQLDLSTDGGTTFDRALGTVPNSGSSDVVVPFATTATARVRASCVGNIFFNINQSNFAVTDGGATDANDDDFIARLEDAAAFTITKANLTDNDVRGSAGDVVAVQNPIGGTASLLAGGDVLFTPTANFNGEAGFDYVLRDDCDRGPGRDTTGEARFPVTAVNDPPTLALDGNVDLPAGAALSGSVPGFADVVSFGPPDESAQTVAEYEVSIVTDADDILTSASIANDGTLSYQLTGNGGSATLSVRARDSGGSANGGNDLSDNEVFAISAASVADLRVSKSNGRDGVSAGATTSYQIVFANDGATSVDDVVISDPIPTGLSAATWTCIGIGVPCPAASGSGAISATLDLPAGASIGYTLTATVTAAVGATIENRAEIAGPPGIDESDLGNNVAIDSDVVFDAFDLSSTIDDGFSTVLTGDGVEYTIVFRNLGASPVDDASLRAPLPAGLTDGEWVCAASNTTCPAPFGKGGIDLVADLPGGSVLTFSVSATVVGPPGTTIQYVADVASPPTQPELETANNTTSDIDDIGLGIDLLVTKDNGVDTLPTGQVTSYTVRYTNAGGRNADDVRLQDTLPPTLPAAVATWTCIGFSASCPAAEGTGDVDVVVDLAAGSYLEFVIAVPVVAAPGATVTNTALASLPAGEFEFDSANNAATDTDPVIDVVIFDDGFESITD